MNTSRYRSLFVALALAAFSFGGLLQGCGGGTSAPAAPADTPAPTLTITGTSTTVTKDPVTLTFLFSEDVGTSFTASDVSVTNGTAASSATKTDATHYTLVVTPAVGSAGTLLVSVAAGAFSDVAGNPSTVTATASQPYDTQAPTVVITGTSSTATRLPLTLTFTFSEDVGTSFTASDVTVTNGTAATSVTRTDATHCTLVVTPPINSVGTMQISVPVGSFTDLASNANSAVASTSQAYDTTIAVAPTFPVFTDAYASGVTFAPFGGSVNAVTVDSTVFHSGTASLKVVVPGGTAYTGGALVPATPQNLSAFNAVTFWAKASVGPVTLNVAGLGNNPYTSTTHSAESTGLPLTTSWAKYTIPIPVSAKATAMDGLFHFAEGPEDGAYTIWLDDIQYETLTGNATPTITGVTVTWTPIPIVAGSTSQLNPGSNTIAYSYPVLPNNGNLYNVGWGYFTLASSNPSVAAVSATGLVTALAAGTTNITGALGALTASGQAVITVSAATLPGPTALPSLPAPPSGSSVISLYSSMTGGFVGSTVVDKHANVQSWIAPWSGGTGGTLFPVTVAGVTANPRQYTMTNAANYVGISLIPDNSPAAPNLVTTNEIDISAMTHFHVDFWTPDEATNLQFKLVDGGADGQINPGYNGILLLRPDTTPALATGHWVSCDVAIDNTGFGAGGNNFPGGNAIGLKHFAQLVIIAAGGGHVYIDNLYFWGPAGGGGGGTPAAPTTLAATPALAAASVIALHTSSGVYTPITGITWNPNWNQASTLADATVATKTVKLLTMASNGSAIYQGVDFSGTAQNITSKPKLHLDYWTGNGQDLSITAIASTTTLPTEAPISIGAITKNGWTSVDVDFSAVSGISSTIQLKITANTAGIFYLDNIYFH